MTLMSTSTLSTHLVTFGAATKTFTSRALGSYESKRKAPMAAGYALGNETFGRMSNLYLHCPDMATRRRLEAFLVSKGAKVNRNYAPTCATVEVTVSYFKGVGWDE